MQDKKLLMQDVEGWPLGHIEGEDEPLIAGAVLGERLAYDRPRDVRKLIARMEESGQIGPVLQRATVARYEIRPGITHQGQEVMEYWLTEAQALKVAAKSETPVADALLDDMIRVFMLARRGMLPGQTSGSIRGALARGLADAIDRGDDEEALKLYAALNLLLGPMPPRAPDPVDVPAPPPPKRKKVRDAFNPVPPEPDLLPRIMNTIRTANAQGVDPTITQVRNIIGVSREIFARAVEELVQRGAIERTGTGWCRLRALEAPEAPGPVATSGGGAAGGMLPIDEHRAAERQTIISALGQTGWNRAKAAARIGMPRRTFYRRLRQHRIQ